MGKTTLAAAGLLTPEQLAARRQALSDAADDRILVLDGAMGTMIQARNLSESDFRGTRFADHPVDLKGNNDLLNLTRPDVVRDIHDAYLAAGADILKANCFNATALSQQDYDLSDIAPEIAAAGVQIAVQAALAAEQQDGRQRFVAGVVGPTSRTASISPDVNDPGYRNITFDALAAGYAAEMTALLSAGADLILIETIFDTLNAKAAIFALDDAFARAGRSAPVMISGTITDRSGRTLSGQTVEAFWISVAHAQPFSVGLNCALGAAELRAYVADLSRVASCRVSAYPNAGLPNAFGAYDEQPGETADHIGEWARAGLVNIIGGCCGTTPDHVAAMAASVANVPPRQPVNPRPALRLSGLEPFELTS